MLVENAVHLCSFAKSINQEIIKTKEKKEMKRKIILSIALVVSIVLVSLTSSDSTAKAQQQNRFKADTGIVTLGPNQILRIVVDPTDPSENTFLRFRQMGYMQSTCSGGVCKLAVASQNTSAPITLMPGETATFDIPSSFLGGVSVAVRGVVESNNRDVRVNAMIIDNATGEVLSVLIALIIP